LEPFGEAKKRNEIKGHISTPLHKLH